VISVNAILEVANGLFDQLQRVLAVDLTPVKFQPRMYSLIATSVGIGNVVGCFLSTVDFSSINLPISTEAMLFFLGCGPFVLGLVPTFGIRDSFNDIEKIAKENVALSPSSLNDHDSVSGNLETIQEVEKIVSSDND